MPRFSIFDWWNNPKDPLGSVSDWHQLSEAWDVVEVVWMTSAREPHQARRYCKFHRFGNSDLFKVHLDAYRRGQEIVFPTDCDWTTTVEYHDIEKQGLSDPKTIIIAFDMENSSQDFNIEYIKFIIDREDTEHCGETLLWFDKIHKDAMKVRQIKKELDAMDGNTSDLSPMETAIATITDAVLAAISMFE